MGANLKPGECITARRVKDMLSESELIELQRSFNKILKDFKTYIRARVRLSLSNQSEHDDLYQIVLINIWQAIVYSKINNNEFHGGNVSMIFDRSLSRYYTYKKERGRNIVFEEILEDYDENGINRQVADKKYTRDYIPCQEREDLSIMRIASYSLSETEATLINLVLEGYSRSEICSMLKIKGTDYTDLKRRSFKYLREKYKSFYPSMKDRPDPPMGGKRPRFTLAYSFKKYYEVHKTSMSQIVKFDFISTAKRCESACENLGIKDKEVHEMNERDLRLVLQKSVEIDGLEEHYYPRHAKIINKVLGSLFDDGILSIKLIIEPSMCAA